MNLLKVTKAIARPLLKLKIISIESSCFKFRLSKVVYKKSIRFFLDRKQLRTLELGFSLKYMIMHCDDEKRLTSLSA